METKGDNGAFNLKLFTLPSQLLLKFYYNGSSYLSTKLLDRRFIFLSYLYVYVFNFLNLNGRQVYESKKLLACTYLRYSLQIASVFFFFFTSKPILKVLHFVVYSKLLKPFSSSKLLLKHPSKSPKQKQIIPLYYIDTVLPSCNLQTEGYLGYSQCSWCKIRGGGGFSFQVGGRGGGQLEGFEFHIRLGKER